MKNLVLIGGGNQAHYTIDIIEKENKYNIIGIIDLKLVCCNFADHNWTEGSKKFHDEHVWLKNGKYITKTASVN